MFKTLSFVIATCAAACCAASTDCNRCVDGVTARYCAGTAGTTGNRYILINACPAGIIPNNFAGCRCPTCPPSLFIPAFFVDCNCFICDASVVTCPRNFPPDNCNTNPPGFTACPA